MCLTGVFDPADGESGVEVSFNPKGILETSFITTADVVCVEVRTLASAGMTNVD